MGFLYIGANFAKMCTLKINVCFSELRVTYFPICIKKTKRPLQIDYTLYLIHKIFIIVTF